MSQSFRARFEQRIARASTGASEDLWLYREAASVLVSFDYESLQPLGQVSPSSSAKTELLADCDTVYPSAGTPRWTLRTPIRQAALRRLFKKRGVDAALAANPNRPDTFAQKLLERLLKDHQDPPRVVRARAAFGSPEENEALLQVVDWLSGVPEFEGKLPSLEQVKQRIAYEHLLDPFRQLVGAHFAGRRKELEGLADYVGVHDAYSAVETVLRVVDRVWSIKDRPPLFINGPGGSGKSTLIAKFILDHATVEQSSRFPFAYLDFDRAGLIAKEPITLLFDIMRQLAIQFPAVHEQYVALAQQWSSRLLQQTSESGDQDSAQTLPQDFRLENREQFISEFAEFVRSLRAKDQPMLLVLDTFEEIQFRSSAFTDEVLGFLEQLQQQVPRLRTVISGRAEIESTEYKFKPVPIGDFDSEAAISYLAGRGLTDTQVAQQIYHQVGGSPLLLRLAADVAKLEKVDEKGIAGLSSWYSIFQEQSIEAVLYKRILGHVYNKRVEELAYPGLVLRVITPEVLHEVLGPACEVSISSLEDARDLVKLMKARLNTILIPLAGEDNVLIHRPDMRSILLSDLKTTAEKKPEIAEKLTNIHKEAVKFYSKLPHAAHRAEEIYHRLALGIDRKVLAERWMEGLGSFLGISSIRELPPASQVYLAARLKVELPEELWSSAPDEDWILYASRLVDQTLGLQKPFDALEVLSERKQLWATEGLQPVVAKVSNAVFSDYARQYEELRETLPGGDRRTGLMNSLVAQIIKTARELSPAPSYAREIFRDGAPGKRVVGISIANALPALEHMDLAIAAIKNAVSPFEQYHALLLARTLFNRARAGQRRALLDALQIQTGTPIHESDPSRMLIKTDLLRRYSTVSIFSIEVLRARKGDCLMLHYGTPDDPHLALIDGGPSGVYQPYLKPRLEQIRMARNLGKSETLPLDLCMISHVDDDHMRGIQDLARELLDARMNDEPQFVQVRSLWHNSFDEIIGGPTRDLIDIFNSEFAFTSFEEHSSSFRTDLNDKLLNKNDIFANFQVLASINQGTQLRGEAQRLKIRLNPEFNGGLIMAAKRKSITIGKGLKFTVIGPIPTELRELQKKHDTWLKEVKTKDLTPRELASAYFDKSVPNVSSIVVMVEANQKRMLLTGDASGDTILQGLEFVGLVRKGGKIHVDVLKVPSHGSSANLYYEFFERVTADHYIISGNGEYGDPDRELFEMLMTVRGRDDYSIHLTYPVPEIDNNRKLDWEKQQAIERKSEGKTRSRARRDWSPTKQSLLDLLEKNPALAMKIRIVGESQPHVINLLEEVTF